MNYYTITSKDDKQYSICSYLVRQYLSKNDYYSKNKLKITTDKVVLKDDIEYTFTSKELLEELLKETGR